MLRRLSALVSPETSAPLHLEREERCVRDLLWRCQLPPSVDAVAVAVALVGHGFVDMSQADFLRVLERPDGDALVLVPRTGRVQIRVHYLVPPELRASRARVLAELVRSLCAVAGGGVT